MGGDPWEELVEGLEELASSAAKALGAYLFIQSRSGSELADLAESEGGFWRALLEDLGSTGWAGSIASHFLRDFYGLDYSVGRALSWLEGLALSGPWAERDLKALFRGITVNVSPTPFIERIGDLYEHALKIIAVLGRGAAQIQEVEAVHPKHPKELVETAKAVLSAARKILKSPLASFIRSLMYAPTKSELVLIYGEDLFSDGCIEKLGEWGIELVELVELGPGAPIKEPRVTLNSRCVGSEVGILITKVMELFRDLEQLIKKYFPEMVRVSERWPRIHSLTSPRGGTCTPPPLRSALGSIKLESRSIYMDTPIEYYYDLLFECVGEKVMQGAGDLYRVLRSCAEQVNGEVREFLKKYSQKHWDWLTIYIRKYRYDVYKKPYGVRAYINWRKFHSFIKELAESDKDIGDKYDYIFHCRAYMPKAPAGPEGQSISEIRVAIYRDLSEAIEMLEALQRSLKKFREGARRRVRIFWSLLLQFLPEMIASIEVIKDNLRRGYVPACYAEMRRIIEHAAWAIVNDAIMYAPVARNTKDNKNPKPYIALIYGGFTPPAPSKRWYDWANEKKYFIRNLSDLKRRVAGRGGAERGKSLIELILEDVANKCGLDDSAVKDIYRAALNYLYGNLGYPLFLAFTGYVENKGSVPEYVPHYEPEPGFEDILAEELSGALQSTLTSRCSERIPSDLRAYIKGFLGGNLRSKVIVPPYPSNSFNIQLLEKILKKSLELRKLYDNCSFFVHPYLQAWQYYPYTSVLEYKILKHEIGRFVSALKEILRWYRKEVLKPMMSAEEVLGKCQQA